MISTAFGISVSQTTLEYHMPYGTITSQTFSYNQRQNGVYVLSTLGLTDLANEYRIRGANVGTKGKVLSASVTRYWQIANPVDASKPYSGIVTVNIQIPKAVTTTAAGIKFMVDDIAAFTTTANVTRLFQGES